jgi:hypothetical protein
MSTVPAAPKRRGLQILLCLVLVVIAGVGWCLYQAIDTAFHAEMALHATNEACDLTNRYVLEHDGAWPRSWDDLKQINCPPGTYNVFPWPESSARIQQFVTIDFAADPDQLAKQSVDEFEAIKPIGPYFHYKIYGFVSSLLESLQKTGSTGASRGEPQP